MRWYHRSTMFAFLAMFVFSQAIVDQAIAAKPKILDKLTKDKEEKTPLYYPMVGDRTGINGLEAVKVEGVGLVVGLKGTGSDPAPNAYRDQILEDMRLREVLQPQTILASESTAVVLLRAFIPPGARKGDKIDVEVWVPPGDGTTSLRNGRLFESEMRASIIAKGRRLSGDALMKVDGPILVNYNGSDPDQTAGLLKGKILGEGEVLVDRDFRIILSRDIRSGSLTKRLAHRINQRFHIRQGPSKFPAAIAKDEKMIELKLLPQYKHDIQRYLLVVRRIPISVSQSFIHQTMEYLSEELANPATAIEAALRLEAIGKDAIPTLEAGLKSDHGIVRFCSAQSLAYLGDVTGAEELAKLAAGSNEYRAYALAALVALDHPVTRISLASLLNSPSVETRYGAFRSQWAYDQQDPVIRGEELNKEFHLHEIDSKAEPMIHLARALRREVVIFGKNQQFKTPLLLKSGDVVIHASQENDQIHVSSFKPSEEGTIRKHALSKLTVADTIRTAVSLGATYPDIVELLHQAYKNDNLPGRLEVNALPKAIPLQTLNAIAISNSAQPRATRVSAPSLFGETGASPTDLGLTAPDLDDEETEKEKEPKKRRTLMDFFRGLAN